MNDKLKHFNVIVIDDDKLVLKLVTDVLYKLGFVNVIRATDGMHALDLMRTSQIDFVICDWRMPRLDGIDLIRQIRAAATPINPLTPVIMLTGNAEVHHVTEARDAGATEYLVKPFTIKELCKRISEIVDHPREFVFATSFCGPTRRRKELVPIDVERRTRRVKPVKVTYHEGRA